MIELLVTVAIIALVVGIVAGYWIERWTWNRPQIQPKEEDEKDG